MKTSDAPKSEEKSSNSLKADHQNQSLKSETSEPGPNESTSPDSVMKTEKCDNKVKGVALRLRQKKIVNKTPAEVIDADAYTPKDVEPPPQPWVAGLSQDDRKRITGGG